MPQTAKAAPATACGDQPFLPVSKGNSANDTPRWIRCHSGPPQHAGKSTLLNAMVGQKLAIVASRPQTTRTSIQGVLTLEDAQIVFIDTPGIHKSITLLNRRMMDAVRAARPTRPIWL